MQATVGTLLLAVGLGALASCLGSQDPVAVGAGQSQSAQVPYGSSVIAESLRAETASLAASTLTVLNRATPTPGSLVVANTGGSGVYIRAGPASANRIKAWPDGTLMLLTGDDRQADGKTWRKVTDPDGSVGWVAAEYLVTPTPNPRQTPTPDRSPYKLELISARDDLSSDLALVTGQVRNISGSSMQNVEAVVQWFSAEGEFVAYHSAFIEYNPILADQVSPFQVLTRRHPEMITFSLEFNRFFGGTIPTLDSRNP